MTVFFYLYYFFCNPYEQPFSFSFIQRQSSCMDSDHLRCSQSIWFDSSYFISRGRKIGVSRVQLNWQREWVYRVRGSPPESLVSKPQTCQAEKGISCQRSVFCVCPSASSDLLSNLITVWLWHCHTGRWTNFWLHIPFPLHPRSPISECHRNYFQRSQFLFCFLLFYNNSCLSATSNFFFLLINIFKKMIGYDSSLIFFASVLLVHLPLCFLLLFGVWKCTFKHASLACMQTGLAAVTCSSAIVAPLTRRPPPQASTVLARI